MKLTVIVLVYNTNPDYLKDCVESIFNSSFKDLKILIVNDGSSIPYPFLENNENIIVLKNEGNKGIPYSCNKAFDYIKSNLHSEYAIRVDSDDIISPSLLEREVSFLNENPDYIGVCCNLQKFGKRDTVVKRPDVWDIEELKKNLEKSNYILISKPCSGYGFAPSMMFRTKALDIVECDLRYPICEDFDFHLKLLKLGKIKSIKENDLYFYRSHDNQITHTTQRMFRINLLREIIDEHFRKDQNPLHLKS